MSRRVLTTGVMAASAVAITLFLAASFLPGEDAAMLRPANATVLPAALPTAQGNADSAAVPAGEARLAPGSAAMAGSALPRSLRGTEVDGGLAVDAQGHFVPTPDAIALFNYFLAASGEEPVEVLRARIVAHIEATLDAPADAEAVALLDRYFTFRERLRELAASGTTPHDLERRLQWIRELRREAFGAQTAEALFAEEEQMVRVDLERRRVATDPALTEAERDARLVALDAELPAAVREARARARAPSDLYREAEALRAGGADEAEVFALREARYDTATAERLAALDAQRAEWTRRLEAYRAERDALLGEAEAWSPAEREAALDALREARFDETEARRVRALDRG